MKEKTITVSIYTENDIGLLNRITDIFLKRHINIESVTASDSEVEQVTRIIIVVTTTTDKIKKIIGQIEKQICVIKAFYHTNDQIIYLQSALFKIKSSLLFDERQIQNIIKESNAQIITVTPVFFVIEKSGRVEEVEKLYKALLPYGILQFVRSGRISISKDKMDITKLLRKQLNKQK